MATSELFRDDAYMRSCSARVLHADMRGIVLDQTVFYPTGGGQPGDQGVIRLATGAVLPVANTVYGDERSEIVHVLAEEAALPAAGENVDIEIDWARRHRLMRMHTCLHLLSALLAYPVTGGQVGTEEGRLDFDMPDAGADREALTAELNALVAADRAVRARWISEAELDADPGLVKTMSVQPPRGSGHVRLIEIEDCDLQPCGGTHVARTGEIGPVAVIKIEKKGAKNRRVRVAFIDEQTA